MNRFTREMRRQGSERFLKIGSRLFTFHHMANGKGRELSEVLDAKENTISVLPGYWRGYKNYGFPLINSAALYRKSAMAARDSFRRRHFISKAFEELRNAKTFGAPHLDPVVSQQMQRAA
jgi:hypothetical protein